MPPTSPPRVAWLPSAAACRALVAQTPDSLLLLDATGQIRSANPAATRLFGLDAARLPRNPLALVHPDDRLRLGQLLIALLLHPDAPAGAQLRAGAPDAARRWTDCTGSNLLQDAAVQGLVLSFRDLSAWWPSTTPTPPAESVPLAVVATHAHDVKSPLTAGKGFTQLLLRRLAAGRPLSVPLVQEQLGAIDRAVDKTLALIDTLLAAAEQPSAPRLQRQDVNLIALARCVVAAQAQLAPEHQLRVETSVSALWERWDPLQLERVLDNLVSNAVKYSPMGGSVWVRLSRTATVALIVVEDAGIGIPAADLPYIFEPFYRASNVGATRPGSGLGLAGVRQLVEEHGGSIAAANRAGGGTRITVRLPLDAAASQQP